MHLEQRRRLDKKYKEVIYMVKITELKSQYIWIIIWICYMFTSMYPIGATLMVRKNTLDLWQFTENLPAKSIVVLGGDGIWGFDQESTAAAVAWVKQCARRGLRLVNVPLSVESWSVEWKIVEMAKVLEKDGGPWKYGVDFVQFPFIPGGDAAFVSFVNDVWKTSPTDSFGTLLTELPLMKDLHNGHDIALWGVPHWNISQVIRFGTSGFGIPAAHFAQAGGFVVSLQYTYIYPGKVFVTNGLLGGAEYEKLENYKGLGYIANDGYTLYSIAFVAFFILGNFVMLRRREGEGKL